MKSSCTRTRFKTEAKVNTEMAYYTGFEIIQFTTTVGRLKALQLPEVFT